MENAKTPIYDPQNMCAGELYINTRSSHVKYADKLKMLRDIRNSPFKINSKVLNEGLAIIMQACLAKFGEGSVTEKLSMELHQVSDLESIKNQIIAETNNIIKVAKNQIGTHTGKIPNPSVDGPGGLIRDSEVLKEAFSHTYLSTATLKSKILYGGAGNAGDCKAQRVLSCLLNVDGQELSMFEDIGNKGILYEALLKLGFNKDSLDEVSDIISCRLNGEETSKPGRYAKALYWPTDNGDVVITPVHPYAMAIEVNDRFWSRIKTGSQIVTDEIKIGGSNPVNSGLINSILGGRYQMFKSVPPKIGSRPKRALHMANINGQLKLATVGKTHPAIVRLKSVIADKRSNMEVREQLSKSILSIIAILVSPWVAFERLIIEKDSHAEFVLNNLPESFQLLITKGYSSLSSSSKSEFLHEITNQFFHPKYELIGSDEIRQVVKKIADIYLDEKF